MHILIHSPLSIIIGVLSSAPLGDSATAQRKSVRNALPKGDFEQVLMKGKRNRTNENRIKTMKIGILWAKMKNFWSQLPLLIYHRRFLWQNPHLLSEQKKGPEEGREIIFEGV